MGGASTEQSGVGVGWLLGKVREARRRLTVREGVRLLFHMGWDVMEHAVICLT